MSQARLGLESGTLFQAEAEAQQRTWARKSAGARRNGKRVLCAEHGREVVREERKCHSILSGRGLSAQMWTLLWDSDESCSRSRTDSEFGTIVFAAVEIRLA